MSRRVSLALPLLVVLAGCGAALDPVAGPSAASSPTASPELTASPYQPVTDAVRGIITTGPRGCVDAATLDPIVVWTIENLPDGATLAKGYHFDDDVTCDATEQQQRTQNGHLRIIPTGPRSVRVEFDRDADCRTGRQQPDVSLDGSVLIGMVITRPKGCKRADPPTEPPPPLPPPPPPPPPEPACPQVRIWDRMGPWSDWSACVNGTQRRTALFCARVVKGCPTPPDEVRTEWRACR